MLAEKKLAFEGVIERPWEERAGLYALPELVETGGERIRDGRAIAEYLDETHSTPALMSPDPVTRAGIRALVNRFDERLFAEVTSVILHERVLKRFEALADRDPDQHALRFSFEALRDHLSFIGSRADEHGYLAGPISLADLTAAAHISCIDYFGDVPWQSFPSAREWYARIKSRPSFRLLLSDNLPGFAPAPHYANLDF